MTDLSGIISLRELMAKKFAPLPTLDAEVDDRGRYRAWCPFCQRHHTHTPIGGPHPPHCLAVLAEWVQTAGDGCWGAAMSDVSLPDGHEHSWSVQNQGGTFLADSYLMQCACGWKIEITRDDRRSMRGVTVARVLKDAALMARACPADPGDRVEYRDLESGARSLCHSQQRRLDARVTKVLAKANSPTAQ